MAFVAEIVAETAVGTVVENAVEYEPVVREPVVPVLLL